MSTNAEQQRLDGIAAHSRYAEGVNTLSIAYAFGIFSRFLRPGSILEMGPAEGVMTDRLVTLGRPLTVVEGASSFCDDLRSRHPRVEVVNSLFETFDPGERRFDNIIVSQVLEHVDDPVDLLRRAKGWMTPTGCIFACVPNAHSLHRQAGVLLGQLGFEEDMNELDIHHGHRRVYHPGTFRRDFHHAGLNIVTSGGFWLKPLANAQLEQDWSEALLRTYFKLGERYPEIAACIYVLAGPDGAAR